jgi:hypothetical protein
VGENKNWVYGSDSPVFPSRRHSGWHGTGARDLLFQKDRENMAPCLIFSILTGLFFTILYLYYTAGTFRQWRPVFQEYQIKANGILKKKIYVLI